MQPSKFPGFIGRSSLAFCVLVHTKYSLVTRGKLSPEQGFINMYLKKLVPVPGAFVVVALALPGCLKSQTFTTVHSFTGGNSANPAASLIVVNNRIYGTSSASWSLGNGTVFAMNSDGSGFETLHDFSTPIYDPESNSYTNSDGANPLAGLVLSGSRLYGTACKGGVFGWGAVFAVNVDGTDFTNLHSFYSYDDGANPCASLILSGNTLFGAASAGGNSGFAGTLFSLNIDGTGFSVVHQFTGSDGYGPMAGLVLSSNMLYGTTHGGGISDAGVVFAVNADGTGFTNLHAFSGGSDGRDPESAGLILSDSTLYGTTFFGGTTSSPGSLGYGTVFKLRIDGNGFTNLYNFSPANSDPVNPNSTVILLGNALYGTTAGGGESGGGTVFALNTNGLAFTTLHSFALLPPSPGPYTNSDGTGLQGGVVASGDSLYGTAIAGGSGYGTVFSISFLSTPPQLSISTVAGNLILSWPTNLTGFTLQSSTDLNSSVAWTAVLQGIVILNGQNTVTFSRQTATAGSVRFYRLIR